MPHGKPANTRCIQLDADNLCKLFNDPSRPVVCESFTAQAYVCGTHREEALILLSELEAATES